MAIRPLARYQWSEVAMLRATTDPGGLDLPGDLDITGHDALAGQVAWLSQLWERDEVRTAVAVASPALTGQIDAVMPAGCQDVPQVRRVVLAVASYVLRWQRRPTPFGLFAGVGIARIGGSAQVRPGERQVAARADAAWLGDVVARLQECPELLERLQVVASNAGGSRGDRFASPGSPPDGPAQELAPVEVSVRHSRPVRAALEAAREPVLFGKLAGQLSADFPATSPERVNGMLSGLLAQGMLISSLWAPMTCPDALGYVCARLQEAHAADIPAISDLVRELLAIYHDLQAARTAPAPPWRALAGRMTALSQAAVMPVAVDTTLDCSVQIPEQVAREARDAVAVLYRLSPHPFGYPAWRDYHARFRARYGTGAVVPVLDLVADSGLGLPAGYLGSARESAARTVTERDEKLLALIQRAMADASGEIILTGQVIEDLAGPESAEVSCPSRAEIAVEIRATSAQALNSGRFTLMVTGTPRPGSSMIGRHAGLLAGQHRDLLAATFAVHEPGAVAAQLSFAPRKRRDENVARTSRLLPDLIPIAEHSPSGGHMISLADLAVTADEHRLWLVRLSTGQMVEPRVTHALEAGIRTPPLARFLAEITTSGCAVYKAFEFGTAARMPYLPRIRYRRTILAPARWRLTAGELPEGNAPAATWAAEFRSWQARWRVPRHVAITDHDRRQPVDLDHPAHLQVLRARLSRAGRLELREAAAPEDLAWLGRAHELVLPLQLAAHGPTRPAPRRPVVTAVGAGHLPGRSGVVHAQLHGHPERFDEILTGHLPDLITALGDTAPTWWFRRHRLMRRPEADQYLALYLMLADNCTYGDAAERVTAWAEDLRRSRLLSHLTLATYEPQAGRFGHGAAMDSAHDVFAADSAAAVAQIALSIQAGVPRQALAAASMTDIAVTFAASVPEGLSWLTAELPQGQGHLDPALRDQALRLADPGQAWAYLATLPGGTAITTEWRKRAAALAGYRRHLAEQRQPLSTLSSLVHLHHIRAAGPDTTAERVTYRLARSCALRYLATHPPDAR